MTKVKAVTSRPHPRLSFVIWKCSMRLCRETWWAFIRAETMALHCRCLTLVWHHNYSCTVVIHSYHGVTVHYTHWSDLFNYVYCIYLSALVTCHLFQTLSFFFCINRRQQQKDVVLPQQKTSIILWKKLITITGIKETEFDLNGLIFSYATKYPWITDKHFITISW